MIHSTESRPNFRSDINGLRAWAVGAVILYHFGLPGFGGGFVGVDIFFVISGLLMTGIVMRGLERDAFSLVAFYLARVRRIVPALLVMCCSLLAAGWLFLLPHDFKELGLQTVATLLFVSNFKYWREAGYFDVTSHEKWLLHTWSLSVEWQFYLLLPLLLLAIWKWRANRRTVVWVLSLVLCGSLGLCIALTLLKPKAAFFLLPTRAWEMLIGGVLFFTPCIEVLSKRQRQALECLGFLLVIAAVVGFDTATTWPGWHALLPVLGAALVLFASQSNSLWTANRVAQWLGTRSYSLYLWHWPVVVALAYAGLQDDMAAVAAGLLLTLLLGHLSYRWVETFSLVWLRGSRWSKGFALLTAGSLLVGVAGAAIAALGGVNGRFSKAIELVAVESESRKPRDDYCFIKTGTTSPSCMYGGAHVRVVLLGDSHADSVTTALQAALPNADDGVMDWSYAKCPTLFGVKIPENIYRPNEKCGEFLQWAVQQLATMPSDIPLVIVNRTTRYAIGHNEKWIADANIPSVYFTQTYPRATSAYLQEFSQRLTDTACQLAKSRPVYLMRPLPEMEVDVPRAMSRAMALGQHLDVSISLAAYHQRHDFVWKAQDAAHDQCGVHILDPLPYLCHDDRCYGASNGRPLYFDSNHLSEFGNKLLVPMFQAVFKARA